MNCQLIEAPRAGEIRQYRMFINGEWAEARSGKTFESVNPYTGRPWAVVPEAGDADVDDAVQAARAAFDEGHWGRMTGTERARLMRRLADLIAENSEQLATIESACATEATSYARLPTSWNIDDLTIGLLHERGVVE